MGCNDCTKGSSCEDHKGPQRAAIDDALRRVYPESTWGRPDDEARFGAGVRSAEVRRMAAALAVATKAPTFHRPGGPDDLCEFVWVLCVGRTPALIDVRDGRAAAEGDKVRERYLRVAFSSVARVATIQEVAVELDGDTLREIPQPGVYDAHLLKRMRSIVDLVEASDIEHLDFGLVDVGHPGSLPGEYLERYGVEPAIVNFLFYAAPARTTTTTWLGGVVDERTERGVGPEPRDRQQQRA
jgi:hypothetical protein